MLLDSLRYVQAIPSMPHISRAHSSMPRCPCNLPTTCLPLYRSSPRMCKGGVGSASRCGASFHALPSSLLPRPLPLIPSYSRSSFRPLLPPDPDATYCEAVEPAPPEHHPRFRSIIALHPNSTSPDQNVTCVRQPLHLATRRYIFLTLSFTSSTFWAPPCYAYRSLHPLRFP